ncbi:hypothetical protein [Streptomyces sp. NPDC058989]|uniref:hypothetical protein n=1 Tax=Streptomyces sp. NPDC058989 TaxID=3346686 RepID=UPI0036B34EF0
MSRGVEKRLVHCGLCRCLVPSWSLRTHSHLWFVCADAAACYARTAWPYIWETIGVTVPLGEQPAQDAPLARCDQCDLAAHFDDVTVVRVLDDEANQWFSVISCHDTVACRARQEWGSISGEFIP